MGGGGVASRQLSRAAQFHTILSDKKRKSRPDPARRWAWRFGSRAGSFLSGLFDNFVVDC
jgi:hypothetical protein